MEHFVRCVAQLWSACNSRLTHCIQRSMVVVVVLLVDASKMQSDHQRTVGSHVTGSSGASHCDMEYIDCSYDYAYSCYY